jgi:predicted DNA-binding transcriptional regulator YafY
MARGNQFIRQWSLLKALESRRSGGLGIDELCKELEANRRTVYRDIDDLRAAGFAVDKETREDGHVHYFIPQGARTPPVPFTATELLALYFSQGLLKPLEGTPFKQGIASALAKIERTLPVHALDFVGAANQSLVLKSTAFKNYAAHARKMEELFRASRERRKVDLAYLALHSDEVTVHRFHPYCSTLHNGSFYWIGRSELRDAMRTFLLDRIQRVKVLDETFALPDDFDPEAFLEESFGITHEGRTETVRIEFARVAARPVQERTWHPSQKIEKRGDGSVVLTMETAGLEEIFRWVLSFGPEAKVLAPAALAERVRKAHAEAAKRYSS